MALAPVANVSHVEGAFKIIAEYYKEEEVCMEIMSLHYGIITSLYIAIFICLGFV